MQNKLNQHFNYSPDSLFQFFQIKEPKSVLADQAHRVRQLPDDISKNKRASLRQMTALLGAPPSPKYANFLTNEVDDIELERQADAAALLTPSDFKNAWGWEFHLSQIDKKYEKAAEAAANRGEIDRALLIYEKRLRLFENEWDVNLQRREILEEAIAKFEKKGPAEILPPLYIKLLEFLGRDHLPPEKTSLDRWEHYLIAHWIQKADLYEKLGIEKEKRIELYKRAADELVKSEKFYLDDGILMPSRLAAAILYEKIHADPALIEKTYSHFLEECSPYIKEMLDADETIVFSLYVLICIGFTKLLQFAAFKLNQRDDWLTFLDKEFCLLGYCLKELLNGEEAIELSSSITDKFLFTIAYFFSLGDLLYSELDAIDPERSNDTRKKVDEMKTLMIQNGLENVFPTIELYLQKARVELEEFFNGSLEEKPFDKIADLFSYDKLF